MVISWFVTVYFNTTGSIILKLKLSRTIERLDCTDQLACFKKLPFILKKYMKHINNMSNKIWTIITLNQLAFKVAFLWNRHISTKELVFIKAIKHFTF